MSPLRPIAVLLVFAVAAVSASAGRGLHASQRMGYQGVMACLFELTDLNHDAQLSESELRASLDHWLSRTEQVMDALTPHHILAACDTNNSRQVSWAEITDEPRCLTLAQTEGIAKWLCSRALHGDFTFEGFVSLSEGIRSSLVRGDALAGIASSMRALHDSQTGARRAALARRINAERLSPEVDKLLTDIKPLTHVAAFPIAIVIIMMALVVTCFI